ncbi:MAG: M56 family metallopeptidase [Bacteroidota bacterium]
MITSLLYSALIIGLIYALYRGLLARQTHFGLHRWFLIGGMALAISLPQLEIPAPWTLQTWLQSPGESASTSPESFVAEIPPEIEARGNALVVWEEETPNQTELYVPLAPNNQQTISPAFWHRWSWQDWMGWVYLAGVVLLTIRFLMQMTGLIRSTIRLPKDRMSGYVLVHLPDKGAFSFFHYLFIHLRGLDAATAHHVLAHEKIHADQWHSLDILLAEFLVIVQWFNPLAWSYRKSLKENLEYLTDTTLLSQQHDPQAYQMSLLQASATNHSYQMVANYRHSMLKKRILMMNTPTSSPRSALRVLWLLPSIALMMAWFNFTEMPATPLPVTNWTKGQTVSEPEVAPAPQRPSVSPQQASPFPSAVLVHTPILHRAGTISGKWEGIESEDELCLRFIRYMEKEWNWIQQSCYAFTEFSPKNVSSVGTFTLERKAGTVKFTGSFQGEKGEGNFSFEPSQAFIQELNKKGIRRTTDELLFRMFFHGAEEEEYLSNLAALQQLNLSGELTDRLMVENTPADLVASYQEAGLDIKKYQSLLRSRVPSDLMKEYKAAGFEPKEYQSFLNSRVPSDLMKEYKAAGFEPKEYQSFLNSRVPSDLMKEYKAAGFDVKEYKSFLNSRVPSDLMKEYEAAGFEPKEYQSFLNSRVPSDLMKEYQAAGFEPKEYKSFLNSRVPSDLMKEYEAAGFDVKEHKSFLNSRVPSDLMKEYEDAGFEVTEYQSFLNSRVPSDLMKEYEAAGFEPKEYKSFLNSRVPSELMKEYQAAGFEVKEYKSFLDSRVPSDLMKEYEDAGFDVKEHKSFLNSRVPAKMMKAYEEMGLDVHAYKKWLNQRIPAGFLQTYRQAGYDLPSHSDFITRRIPASLLQKYEAAGLSIEDHRELILDRVSVEKAKRYKESLK